MPIYNYRCIQCRQPDTRVAGLDDHMAVCHVCRGVMLREDADIFKPYFEDPAGEETGGRGESETRGCRGESCIRPDTGGKP